MEYHITKSTRERIIFAWFPIFFNKQIFWLKKVKIIERRYHCYYSSIDEWSYTWHSEYVGIHWRREKVIKI